jgi:shikimate kinase
MKNIYLVGFMGTGKSTVGKALAKVLNKEFKDLDELIEEREKRKIVEIFEQFGEQYFREVETAVVREISERENLVIATGGGVVVNEENFSLLKKSGTLITLVASPEAIYERIKDSIERPLLNVENPLDTIKRMLFERAYYYIKSDFIVDTTEREIDDIISEICELIK